MSGEDGEKGDAGDSEGFGSKTGFCSGEGVVVNGDPEFRFSSTEGVCGGVRSFSVVDFGAGIGESGPAWTTSAGGAGWRTGGLSKRLLNTGARTGTSSGRGANPGA
ncbi:hypothetical protein IWX75_000237 [Arthrobacter sp. CAN_A6]|uniref:hypothetical protein n=1 Tax=Arthrobacter sp. CAN_A6 TaxID=2787721 RepID=UPI001A1F5014